MRRLGCIVGLFLAVLGAAALVLSDDLLGAATIGEETPFVIPAGSSLSAVADDLEDRGLITSADGFLLRARLFGSADPIQAGEFALKPGMDQAAILAAFQEGDVIRHFVTIPEGMPSILVWERVMAEPLLEGEIEVPPEGSILPDTYAFERGQDRAALIEQMQSAMDLFLAQAWAERSEETIAVETIREALILASIVEKETGTPTERARIAGLYSNRIKTGMMLQADPTIIYPITKGKPLGRRIRQSEIAAVNDYNTYTMLGLPSGPITNPGRESIEAVLNPEIHEYLFMVADGTGGHDFNADLDGHNAAVARWFELRRQR
ncbi:MAG: endolytic transglycosylase MltG, partial [Erythrobacter sp.]|nr:endolytic transglycosylase MltG [Erythrobacter sp.]